MATKTFKIGLSNTDKTNMAQDIYERVIGMCFDEYDSTKTYNTGDFVVYENPSDTFKLYKCNSDNVTGAWDGTKWDLATLQDILDDIENAVQYVNDKANVDGNYPTMTVGVADQLSPYDDESGDDQSEPFSFQATGTGNGTQPDFATGIIALMKEKQGNTVALNQLVQNGTFSDGTTNWNYTGGSIAVSSNILTFTASSGISSSSRIQQSLATLVGHKYLASITIVSSKNTSIGIGLSGGASIQTQNVTANTKTVIFKTVEQVTSNGTYLYLYCNLNSDLQENDTVQYSNAYLIDLTQWFNGDIPQDLLDNPENFFRYYQGSLAYNEGGLVNANGRYIKCIGRQQWDEETELGMISTSTGENVGSSSHLRSKNYIKVIPNADYTCRVPSSIGVWNVNWFWYDKDKNFIEFVSDNTSTKKAPANACYLRFYLDDGYGTTYNNDITISLYYEDESGYDQYYPYEVLTNNDTGTEILRSAGNAHDVKLPSGEIKRNVGSVDLGSLSWAYLSSSGHEAMYTTGIQNVVNKPASDSTLAKILCSMFVVDTRNGVYNHNKDMSICVSDDGTLYIYSTTMGTDPAAFKIAMSGVYLFYELATPTTEQGTPYSENLVIDDFGTMDFQGANGVPQGNLIFYPVDYKAFIDTLYDYTEGTPSNIALKSDVSAEESARQGVDTALQNAIGGTLRQCLCVKETLDFEDTDFVDLGSLSWTYDGGVFGTSFTAGSDKSLCTKYTSVSIVATENQPDKTIQVRTTVIYVKDTTYGTDAAAFKASLKGVLLAYEKASE